MVSKEHRDMIAVYLTNSVVGSWHLSPDCAVMRTELTARAHTLVELAAGQAAKGRAPCRRCAYEATLAALNCETAGPGYHYIACGCGHTGEWDCAVCTALTRYGASRPDALGAPTDGNGQRGRVALLLPRAIAKPESDDWTLIRMRLVGASARGKHLPAMNATSWATAALLLGADCTLAKALQAASALHAAPTPTEPAVSSGGELGTRTAAR